MRLNACDSEGQNVLEHPGTFTTMTMCMMCYEASLNGHFEERVTDKRVQ